MPSARDLDLPDLVAGVVDDARALVEAQVSSLKTDLGVRLGDLGGAIKSWLIAGCVAIVTTVLLGLAVAATLAQVVGVPWWLALWIVTAVAVATVVGLVYRARANGRIVADGAPPPPVETSAPSSGDAPGLATITIEPR